MDAESRPLKSLAILLVEDEFLVADYLADLITEAGHSVAAIKVTGEEALSELQGTMIDLAICDIRLKGDLTGIDVAEAASERGIPHLYVSGSGDPSTRKAAEGTKPLAFLQKPVNERELRRILDTLSGRAPRSRG